jgi:hypothetical protein
MTTTRKKKGSDVPQDISSDGPFARIERDDIVKGFLLVAKLEAAKRGFKIHENCFDVLTNFIENGVNEVMLKTSHKDEVSRTLYIDLAEAKLVAFMITMTIEAHSSHPNKNVLHEGIFSAAWAAFCPCWPFCK